MSTTGGPQQVELTRGATRILDAATALFYERGIAGVGVDTIAAASGVTKRTLYDRFGSKDALVTAYLRRRDADWAARWERRIAGAAGPASLTVFDAYAEDAEPSGRGCAFLNAAAELPPGHEGWGVVRAHKARVAGRVAELVERDLGRPDGDLAELIFLLVEGGIAHQRVDGDSRRLSAARRLAAGQLAARR
ncbi:TetR/AcrR family transcriptional regulator [Microbacterium sp. EYE_5]|uniref:TetR/AcrR family transcriptional regulator n=1 Tax=unclassified Microbacterium TaxID=2609290 RepID=UPI002004DB51|nr:MULTISPECIES: TetR/AcrR family transcriptional regulator [unclassified Microbacterium]MCK6080215.1 TetR/AcrR family transcriptional regulator [Microbacterium sp. EYE_382]MCK6085486.1 TetR/AcrR family transcriptional regulator [Microbacterium sp. EYE_384]MCK6122289.1 TetR/AcrR family transcriptional regulator [Microbacterium sp. EYE_80]MCK6126249.1 TetR/AcrR family transcriptional regulator [Microbacterium sp. EYE_79]MCK6141170.1 TetR/AcrR family transcriptional regulator [Microbacterium sp.